MNKVFILLSLLSFVSCNKDAPKNAPGSQGAPSPSESKEVVSPPQKEEEVSLPLNPEPAPSQSAFTPIIDFLTVKGHQTSDALVYGGDHGLDNTDSYNYQKVWAKLSYNPNEDYSPKYSFIEHRRSTHRHNTNDQRSLSHYECHYDFSSEIRCEYKSEFFYSSNSPQCDSDYREDLLKIDSIESSVSKDGTLTILVDGQLTITEKDGDCTAAWSEPRIETKKISKMKVEFFDFTVKTGDMKGKRMFTKNQFIFSGSSQYYLNPTKF